MAEHVLWRRIFHESRKPHPAVNAAYAYDLPPFSLSRLRKQSSRPHLTVITVFCGVYPSASGSWRDSQGSSRPAIRLIFLDYIRICSWTSTTVFVVWRVVMLDCDAARTYGLRRWTRFAQERNTSVSCRKNAARRTHLRFTSQHPGREAIPRVPSAWVTSMLRRV